MINDSFGKKHDVARRSLTKKIMYSGTVPSEEAFMWIDGDKAAIFNCSIPYERFFLNGVEVDTRYVERDDSIVGEVHVGREYTLSDILLRYNV